LKDREDTSRRTQTVRFWTALVIYAGAGWAATEMLLAVRQQYRLPESLDTVVIALFVAGLLAMVLLLKTRVVADAPPILHALRALAIVLLFAAAALLVAHWLQPSDGDDAVQSVAMLPCDYEGPEEDSYLALGLAEGVHNRLASLAELHVPAWRAVLQASRTDPADTFIARHLGLQRLARCRLMRDGSRVTLDASLIDPSSGSELWTSEYVVAGSDLVGLMANLAVNLTEALKVRVSERQMARVGSLPTNNPAALELYLRARSLPPNADQLPVAIELLEEAVRLDANFANAWATLALAETERAFKLPEADAKAQAADIAAAWERAARYVDKAIAVDPELPEAWVAKREVWRRQGESKGLWKELEEPEVLAEFHRRILQLAPNDAPEHAYWAERLLVQGEVEKAEAAASKAWSLDPTNIDFGMKMVRVLTVSQDRIDEGLAILRTMYALQPDHWRVSTGIGYTLRSMGRLDSALAWLRHAASLNPRLVIIDLQLAYSYSQLGLPDHAAAVIEDSFEKDEVSFGFRAILYAWSLLELERIDDARSFVESWVDTTGDFDEAMDARDHINILLHAGLWELWAGDLSSANDWFSTADVRPIEHYPRIETNAFEIIVTSLGMAQVQQHLGEQSAAAALLEDVTRTVEAGRRLYSDATAFRIDEAGALALAGQRDDAVRVLLDLLENPNFGDVGDMPRIRMRDPALGMLWDDHRVASAASALLARVAEMRERVLAVESSGDWESLRTF
jgi:tetratricopeptide (TPR) repeat protein